MNHHVLGIPQLLERVGSFPLNITLKIRLELDKTQLLPWISQVQANFYPNINEQSAK